MRITGEGLDTPIERITPVNIRPEDIPVIPPGARRLFEVRAYSGEPSSAGSVVSVGRSFPFDMPEKGAPADPIRVTLRRVNTFLPVESSQVPGTCLDLTQPRAGHTATLLEDGRVVLAGGFRLSSDGQVETLSSIEILDPQARTLAYVEDPGPGAAKRAFHTASRMLDGRVALIGGESQPLSGTATPLRTGAVFDPVTGKTQQFELGMARSHHAAAIDLAGRILVVGGVGAGGAVVSSPEGVEPAGGRTFPVPTSVPRMGASVVTLADNQRLAVVGGSDGVNLPREVLTFVFNGSTFAPTNTSVVLRQPRRDAAVVAFDDEQKLLVVGGYSTPETPDGDSRPVSASELVGLQEGSPFVAVGPSIVARGDLCAVSLPDGRALTTGGRRVASDDGFASSGVVELITPTPNVTGGVLGMQPLEPARYLHTCTPLPDGSVLIAGGLNASDRGSARLAAGTYIFMPVPRD
ncbi:MAG: kelch repeat-containing protein [Hyalangium sp.]|uniref:kelch repeat-containing protein n=1 Tax=Hyalangium sp. TaxID=2028555 RepID=UPI00389AFFFE